MSGISAGDVKHSYDHDPRFASVDTLLQDEGLSFQSFQVTGIIAIHLLCHMYYKQREVQLSYAYNKFGDIKKSFTDSQYWYYFMSYNRILKPNQDCFFSQWLGLSVDWTIIVVHDALDLSTSNSLTDSGEDEKFS